MKRKIAGASKQEEPVINKQKELLDITRAMLVPSILLITFSLIKTVSFTPTFIVALFYLIFNYIITVILTSNLERDSGKIQATRHYVNAIIHFAFCFYAGKDTYAWFLSLFTIIPTRLFILRLSQYYSGIALVAIGTAMGNYFGGESLYHSLTILIFIFGFSLIISKTIGLLKDKMNDLSVAQKKLKKINKQLEDTIFKANEMATQAATANHTKSEFLANMSHEIRTPLNSILGLTEILLEDELTEENRDALEIIQKSGDILLNLINDILDLSKIENHHIELETIPFNTENLVLDIGEAIRANIGKKPVEINCLFESAHTNVVGDPTRLRQILTNLMGNAIKFTEEGEIVISVATEKEDKKNVTLRYSVRDTGIGIPKEKLATIFDSFNQADGSITRKFGGTGLGLTISKKLSQLMDGNLWAESKPGKGSTFHMLARVGKGLSPEEKVQPLRINDLKGKHVLVVDDMDTALKVVSTILTKIEMKPVTAKNGYDALIKLEDMILQKTSPEIAIVDIMMPGMSGFELAPRLHKKTNGKIKVIAISSKIGSGISKESEKAGFSGFAAKPIRPQTLIDLILSVMGHHDKPLNSIISKNKSDKTPDYDIKILYAEDNPNNRKVAHRMLERIGYNTIEIVEDGAQAVEAVKTKGPYDIIFMDMQMPNIDGLEATRLIRKFENKQYPIDSSLNVNEKASIAPEISKNNSKIPPQRVPIIALTANAMKGTRQDCLEAGMDEYIAKPFKKQEIQHTIKAWVHKRETSLLLKTNKRVLIVEDDAYMRNSLQRTLRKERTSLTFKWAKDGIDATAKLGSFKPDLVITDLMMPGMDGVEFIEYIHRTDRYKNVNFIVITGLHKSDPKLLQIKNIGIEHVFFKPFDYNELILTMKNELIKSERGVENEFERIDKKIGSYRGSSHFTIYSDGSESHAPGL